MRYLFTLCWATLLTACSRPPELKENLETITRVNQTLGLITQHEVNLKEYHLHYVSGGNPEKPNVVFVHGTPGSWGSFAAYFERKELLKDYHIYVIDRPGWGQSTYPSSHFPVSLSEQSKLLGPLLQQIVSETNQKVILVGHSYGGSLVPKLAFDYPQYIRSVLILAGDIEPKLAKARWYNFMLKYIPDFMIPKPWNESNQEVLAIAPSLELLQEQYQTIKQPITLLQGTDDKLVRPDNAKFVQSIFPESKQQVIWLEKAGHIINLTNVEDVIAAIKSLDSRS